MKTGSGIFNSLMQNILQLAVKIKVLKSGILKNKNALKRCMAMKIQ